MPPPHPEDTPMPQTAPSKPGSCTLETARLSSPLSLENPPTSYIQGYDFAHKTPDTFDPRQNRQSGSDLQS
ncbi:UNVERIFIED_CONTAM: hypothetical protein Slati_3444900 [Sesamum latifolium]|uniref:Uncharacterized protein n=1 Tax=Sesamum latifolium TaxID=2727402 RepID=A0AAW2UIS1_9LAMI